MTDISFKNPCKVATTGNISLSAPQTIDSVAVVAGDRILVKNQTNPVQNGIWTVAAGSWTRATDFNGATEVVGGTMAFVTGGSTQASTTWYVSGSGAITPGTSAISFAENMDARSVPYTDSVRRSVANRVGDLTVIPEDFGATGVEGDDQTDAINKWLVAIGEGAIGRLRGRDYKFTSALTLPLVNKRTIVGDNSYRSRLLYAGGSPTIDLVTLGDGNAETRGWLLRDFTIDSSTRMTAGYALRLRRAIFCDYDGVVLSGQYDSSQVNDDLMLFNGVYFDGYFYSTWRRSDVWVRGVGVSVAGTGGYCAGLSIGGGNKIGNCETGILVGGGASCLIDEVDVIGCVNDGIRFDTSLTSTGNLQTLIGNRATFDTNGRDGIRLDDSVTGGFQFLHLDGTWSASNKGHNINIMNWGSGIAAVQLDGVKSSNSDGDAFRNSSNNNNITINGGQFDYSGRTGTGVGLRNTGAGIPTVLSSPTFYTNASGDWAGEFVGFPRSFTSSVTAISGTVTATLSLGQYKQSAAEGSGQRVALAGKITVPTKGTHVGLRITLPIPAKADIIQSGAGFNPVTGKPITVYAYGNNLDFADLRVGGSPVSANGEFFFFNIEYDAD